MAAVTRDLVHETLELALRIQTVPAPTFAEERRSELVFGLFREAGLQEVRRDAVGSVTGIRPGTANGPAVMVSAHLDTVFGSDTDLHSTREADKIAGPGIGDNSLGVAGLVALLWMLDGAGLRLPCDLILAANVREEGLGDLQGMRALIRHYSARLKAVVVLEGTRLGRITFQGVGSRRYRVAVRTAGGHSWADFGRRSAVHELVGLAHELCALPVPRSPKTTYNIGVIQGGTSINSIAAEASLLLDLRSEDPGELERLDRTVRKIVHRHRNDEAEVTVELVGDRPAGSLEPGHPLVRAAMAAAEAAGVESRVEAASTDANAALAADVPAVCVGLTRGGHVHTTQEYILIPPLASGLRQLAALVVESALLEPDATARKATNTTGG